LRWERLWMCVRARWPMRRARGNMGEGVEGAWVGVKHRGAPAKTALKRFIGAKIRALVQQTPPESSLRVARRRTGTSPAPMPPKSSPATAAVNLLCGAERYSSSASEERTALLTLLAQPDAEARLLPLIGDRTVSRAGQCYALEGLQALQCAAAVHAIRRVAEDESLASSFDLYTMARDLPVGALLRLCGVGDHEVEIMTTEAGLRTAGELVRYCRESQADDGAEGEAPSGADEMALRALSLECCNAIPLESLRTAAEEAISLLALTRRKVATQPAPEPEEEDEHSKDVGCGGDEPLW
jgi:hypothetical protein